MQSLLSSGVAALSLGVIDAAQDTWRIGKAVTTTSGDVTGRLSSYAGSEQFSGYLGIPCAAPPVGNQRWLAPQPDQPNGTITANKFVSIIEESFQGRQS